ncbi:helix-turn-helix domain-containing protein [Paenibacillus sp. NPDC057886]|uniref:helix-turn-helix domain-containing protein n=1 Tax=Paenibacillus sp. NPDC057886 TaxID=3346270 RepID=UPI0036B09C14
MERYKTIESAPFAVLEDANYKLRQIQHIRNTSNDWELKLQFIESHLLLVTSSGQGWITMDGQHIKWEEGCVYIFTPGQLVQAETQLLDDRGCYLLRFDIVKDSDSTIISSLETNKENFTFPIQGKINLSSTVSVNSLCEKIAYGSESNDFLKRFRSQILFQELLYEIFQDSLLVLEHDPESALEYVKSYMERHFQRDLSIEHLANVAGISPRHFMRLFKKRFGCSAIDYLAVFRIDQAQKLMKTGSEYRLKDIAHHVGYSDDIYFRRKFKQITGIPPATFIRNNKQKIVAYNPLNIGQLLPLQITPSAAPGDHPWTDYYKRKYGTDLVLSLNSTESMKRRELLLTKPDYIIGIDSFVSVEEQAQIKRIAPSFFVPWMEKDWREHLQLIAAFLGKSSIAELWFEKYERKSTFVREQIQSTINEDTLLVLRVTGEHYNILGHRSLTTVFYDDLHITPANGIDPSKPDYQVKPAELAAYDADRLLIILDEDARAHSSWQLLKRSEAWRNLKAVKNRRVDFLPTYPWVEYTAFTNDLVLDEALKLWRNRA